jgi:sugar phosphate permease
MSTLQGTVGGAEFADPALATRVRWRLIAPTLLVMWTVSMFDKSNIGIVMADPAFLKEMGLVGQPARLGWLAGSLFIAYALTAPFWGWLVARIGPRRAAAISLLIWAATCFASGVAHSYNTLLLSRFLLGFGEAALYPVTLTLVANWFGLRERGRATAFWWCGTMIGPMLTGLLVTGLIVHFGWRIQFHVLGLIALVVPLPMIWLLVRDTPAEHPGVNEAERDLVFAGAIEHNEDAPGLILRGVSSFWRNYRYWLAVAAISGNTIFFWGWSTWLPSYLRQARGYSFSTSGYLTFVVYGCAIAVIIAGGLLSDRLFRRSALAGFGWLLGGVFLISAALVPGATASVILMILALCAQQIGISNGEMLFHSLVSTRDMSQSQGVRSFIAQSTGALSPVMIGYLLAATGGFTGAMAVLSAAVVVSAGCMVLLARQRL